MGGTGDKGSPVGEATALQQLLDADARTNVRIRNCNYLTEKLAEVPGITPPYVRPGYKHVYHYYTCLWDADYWGISRDRFLEALNAEGVFAVAYIKDANYTYYKEGKPLEAGGPIHLRTIFQERNLYGHGCPFQCPHEKNPPVYREGDLPVSESLWKQEFCFQQPDLSPPNNQEDMDLILEAICKVLDNVDKLRDSE